MPLRLPAAAATGIGSLPHEDPLQALALIARYCPELPFWPQLAPLRHGPRASMAPDAPGLLAFEAAMRQGLFPQACAIKGQLWGPVTWQRICDLEARQALDEVQRAAEDQVRRLRRFGLPVLICLDEPSLAAAEQPEAALALTNAALRAIEELGASPALHCCATPDPRWMQTLRLELFFFDAALGLPDLLRPPCSTTLGLGLVPTSEPLPSVAQLVEDLRQAALIAGRSLSELLPRALVTASCGLGTLSLAQAEARLILGAELALDFRRALVS